MKDQDLSVEELQEEHMDELIRLAFKYEDTLVAKQILDEEDASPLPQEEKRLARRILDVAWRKYEKEELRQRDRQHSNLSVFFKHLIPIAACIVFLLSIATPVAIASNAYLRSKVMQLLISIDEERGAVNFGFIEDENFIFDVPVQWDGSYFPSFIPDGFTISSYDSWESVYSEIIYMDNEDASIKFEELGNGAGGSSGIEGGVVTYTALNGRTAMVCQSEDKRYIEVNWSTDDRWMVIKSYGLPYEVTIKIAESVKRIIK